MAFPTAFGKSAKMNKRNRLLTEIAARCSRNCIVGRSAFRDGIAELLSVKFYSMLEEGKESELVELLTQMELTKDDVTQLREIVDFDMKSLPDAKVLKASFTRQYNSAHSASQQSYDSVESQRADYFIIGKSKGGKKAATRKKK
jgi:hypothetical protein